MKDMKEIRAVKPDVLCGQVSGKENNLVHRSVIIYRVNALSKRQATVSYTIML